MTQLAPLANHAKEDTRRRERRYVCVCGGVASLAVRPIVGGRRGMLTDVSAGGVGLLLESPLEEGTALAVQLPGPGVEARPAKIAYCRPCAAPSDVPWLTWRDRLAIWGCRLLGMSLPASARAWLAGCAFRRPLTDEELREVLGAAGPPVSPSPLPDRIARPKRD